jgi:hypothetical protein
MTMPRFTLDEYGQQWPRVGAVLGIAIGRKSAAVWPRRGIFRSVDPTLS